MKYFRGFVSMPIEAHVPAITAKAIAVTVAGGYTAANDTLKWLPKSQLRISEPNEVGNAEILIPYWLLKKAGIDFYRIREISRYNGEPEIVER